MANSWCPAIRNENTRMYLNVALSSRNFRMTKPARGLVSLGLGLLFYYFYLGLEQIVGILQKRATQQPIVD